MTFIIIFILAFVIWCFLKISSIATELEEKMQKKYKNNKSQLRKITKQFIIILAKRDYMEEVNLKEMFSYFSTPVS